MSNPPPSATDWRSYDSVAEVYEHAASRFLPLGRDLVAAVSPPAEGGVLDLGTGTGLVAGVAREAVGPQGFVTGVDPSLGMLRRAIAHGIPVVAGMLPGLPFRDSAFAVVTANLVLSHLEDYEDGLEDAVRVLIPGGRLGCTAWGPEAPASDQNQAGTAHEIVETLERARGLDVEPPVRVAVSEDALRDGNRLELALRGAGLTDTRIEGHTYHWNSSVDEYLLWRAWTPRSRYVRQQVDSQQWHEIQERAAAEIRRELGEEIRSTGNVWVAVGTKP